METAPAAFVLYRAVKDMCSAVSVLGDFESGNRMKNKLLARYGLLEMSDMLAAMETEFFSQMFDGEFNAVYGSRERGLLL